jgi:hypothetical protein
VRGFKRPLVRRLASGEGMVEKAFPVEPHQKAVLLIRHRSVTIAIGVGAFLLFISETVGTVQELRTGTIEPSDRASMERSGRGGISNPVTADGQPVASPGQWLIDDVARERAEFELRQVSPKQLSATNAARDAAHVEAGVGLPSSDDSRAGGDKRRSEDVTSSIGTPAVAPSLQRVLKRSDGGGRVDSAAKCIEAPVGLAPEGEHWHYRFDRETHRKCWYLRAFREDRARRSIVESDRRLSERTSPDPRDSAWAWWYWW